MIGFRLNDERIVLQVREIDRKTVLADFNCDMNEIIRSLIRTIDTVKEVQRQAEEAGSNEEFVNYSPKIHNQAWGEEIRIPKKYFDEGFLVSHPGSDKKQLKKCLAVWRGLHLLNCFSLACSSRPVKIGSSTQTCICVSVETYEFCKELLDRRQEQERASHRGR